MTRNAAGSAAPLMRSRPFGSCNWIVPGETGDAGGAAGAGLEINAAHGCGSATVTGSKAVAPALPPNKPR